MNLAHLAEPPVPVVGDVSAVHDLSEEVPEVLPGDPVVGLQVVEEHVGADHQVPRVERVRLVPALGRNSIALLNILLTFLLRFAGFPTIYVLQKCECEELFQQSKPNTEILGTKAQPYDASRNGPLCPQTLIATQETASVLSRIRIQTSIELLLEEVFPVSFL